MTTAKLSPKIDPFRSRQVRDVGTRFRAEQDKCRRAADLMWAGAMAAAFTDHELKLLSDLGRLCPHDLALLAQVGRKIAP